MACTTHFDRLGDKLTIMRRDTLTGREVSRDFDVQRTNILLLAQLIYFYGCLDIAEAITRSQSVTVNEYHKAIEQLLTAEFGPN